MKTLLLSLILVAPSARAFLGQPLSTQSKGARARTQHQQPLYMSVPNPLDILTSGLASVCRFQKGVTAAFSNSNNKNDDDKLPRLMQLYDVENNVACRAVRERITELDLNVEKVIPATANSRVFLDKSYEYALPVGAQIPRLVVEDANGKEQVLEGAKNIVSYLDEWEMGDNENKEETLGEIALDVLLGFGGLMSNLLRLGRGVLVSEAAACDAVDVVPRPQQQLILYSYEGNQFCRLVREVLTELDIVYELRSAGKQSQRREELAKLSGGSTTSPFLLDPNTGVQMGESADIIQYLYRTYALWTPPNEVLEGISNIVLPWFRPILTLLTPWQAGSLDNDKHQYEKDIELAQIQITEEVTSNPVVIYTYGLSPFSIEAKKLLENLDIPYKEVSLGGEWLPGLIGEGGSKKRAALLEMTGQSSLPNIFIGGKSIGGLFSGSPGLVPLLERGEFRGRIEDALGDMLPSDDELAEMALKMAKPSADFEAEKLTKEKLQRAMNMADSSENDPIGADGFW